MKVKFIEGKRYDSTSKPRYYVKIIKRTSRYLHVDYYYERPYTSTFGVRDFRREKMGSYMLPVSQFKGRDPEYFFFVENNERIWFEADNVH